MLTSQPNINKIARELFRDGNSTEAFHLLPVQCANNTQSGYDENECKLNKLRFRTGKDSKGNSYKIRSADETTRKDWNDIIASADPESKNKRKERGDVLKIESN